MQEPVAEVDHADRDALLSRFAPVAFKTLEQVCNDDAAPAAARVSASSALLGIDMTKPATETKITAAFDAPTQHLAALQELNRLAQAPRLIKGAVAETVEEAGAT